jgi:hypothetical protein
MNEQGTPEVARRSSGKPWSGIVFAFVVGVIVGGIVMVLLVRTHAVHVLGGRPPIQQMIGQRVTEGLALTADEQAGLARILDEYKPAFEALRDSSRAEVRKTADRMEGRIRELLTSEQQAKFDQNVARIHEQLRAHAERERAADAKKRDGADTTR